MVLVGAITLVDFFGCDNGGDCGGGGGGGGCGGCRIGGACGGGGDGCAGALKPGFVVACSSACWVITSSVDDGNFFVPSVCAGGNFGGDPGVALGPCSGINCLSCFLLCNSDSFAKLIVKF